MFTWQAKGCKFCNNLGYKGRIGIYEAILIDDEVEPLILLNPTETEILEEIGETRHSDYEARRDFESPERNNFAGRAGQGDRTLKNLPYKSLSNFF